MKITKKQASKSKVVKEDKFASLTFTKEDYTFEGTNSRMLYGVLNGNFTRDEIIKKVQEIADELAKRGRKASIATACHYEDVDTWMSGKFTNVENDVKVPLTADSDTTLHYGENIDKIIIYIIEDEAVRTGEKPVYRRPKRELENVFKK